MNFPTIFPVTSHTDHIGPGSTFVAIKGFKQDGIAYIPQALQRGATTIVVQEDAVIPVDIRFLIEKHGAVLNRVSDTRKALATLSAQAHGYPARKLTIFGVTGTKGKTTSVVVLHQLLQRIGFKVGLLSSVHNSIDDVVLPTHLTTQQPDYLHQFFSECLKQGVTHVVMEVAAQAFSLYRVYGIEFGGIIFTNFDATHAEFYPTVDDYFAAKTMIFNQLKPGAPILINADNSWCQKLIAQYPTLTFGLHADADYKAVVQGNVGEGITFDLTHNNKVFRFHCPTFIGLFSVYNLVGVVSLALELGIGSEAISQALLHCTVVPGRLERYELPNGAWCIIDYAHNSLSFESILSTLRPLTESLIVVFGCGGDRDATMRPVMGAIAAKYADNVLLTTDNPRSEDPAVIIENIIKGIPPELRNKVSIIVDRKEAIERAYALSKPGAIIALLGKGRDEYQQVGTVKTKFSELEIVRSLQKNAFQ